MLSYFKIFCIDKYICFNSGQIQHIGDVSLLFIIHYYSHVYKLFSLTYEKLSDLNNKTLSVNSNLFNVRQLVVKMSLSVVVKMSLSVS